MTCTYNCNQGSECARKPWTCNALHRVVPPERVTVAEVTDSEYEHEVSFFSKGALMAAVLAVALIAAGVLIGMDKWPVLVAALS